MAGRFPKAVVALVWLTILVACSTNRVASTEPKTANTPTEPFLTHTEAQQRASHLSQVHYDLEFLLRADQPNYSGQTKITFDYRGERQPVRIDFFQGEIRQLAVNGKELKPDYNSLFLIIPASALKVGPNAVLIQFQRSFSRDGHGLVRFEDPEDKRVYTYTDLEPYDANRVFPCFDQPDLKATYAMKVTAPKSWQVVTSVRESSIQDLGNDTQVWDFPTSAKFSTYIWSLHSGPYRVWQEQAGSVPMRLLARESLAKYVVTKDWFTFTRQGLEFFPKYFGYPYPYKKYDQVIVPEFNSGAMENVAAVTFSERFISRGPMSERNRRGMANTILHEMAHMWFGDLVTMKWWNDLWLNESFATYMAHLALAEATEFKSTAWRSFYGTKDWAYWEDQLVTTHPIEAQVPDTRQAFANFDGITYGKGASVLKQVAYFIGPDRFQKGVQSYFKKYAEKNTELKDFMNELSTAHGSSLEDWQKQWLQTPSLNTVSVGVTCDQGKVTDLKVTQTAPPEHPYQRSHRFRVAFFKTRGARTEVQDIFNVRLESSEQIVPEAVGKSCPALTYPNYDDYGYLKVNLDSTTIKNLPQMIHTLNDSFHRQLFWAALWDMVLDSNLHLLQYADLAMIGAEKERDEETLRDILNTLHGRYSNSGSVLYYFPDTTDSQRAVLNTFAGKLERLAWRKLVSAKPGSELQKIWLSSVMTSARTTYGLGNLKLLLDEKIKLRSLPIDQDKRWSIVNTLASHNFEGVSEIIEAELKRDASAEGQKSAIGARAAIPNWETKERWLSELLKKDSTYSFDQLKAAMYSLFPRNQIALREKYGSQFFLNLAKVAQEREGFYASAFADLVPSECFSTEHDRITQFLKDHRNLDPSVEKSLKISRQEDDRCRKIRALAQR